MWGIFLTAGIFAGEKQHLNFHQNCCFHMAQELAHPANENTEYRGGLTLLHRSCHDCNRRKVRCNKTIPCDNCVRLGVECTFPPPGRKPRKTPKRSSNKSDLTSRLSLLEQQVQELGTKSVVRTASADSQESPENSQPLGTWLPTNRTDDLSRNTLGQGNGAYEGQGSPVVTSGTLEDQVGRLVVDRNSGTSRYVNHRVLTDLAEQVNSAPLLSLI